MSNLSVPTLQSSQADVWYLKKIEFKGKSLKIITQNFNGPCSFIAICNILILRGNIVIEPPTRQTVSYEFLSQLVAEYLLNHSPNVDISDALSIMPYTQKGLDLNPLFTSSTSFLAATSTAGGELKLFSQVGIDLVHGWLVDPESPAATAMREEKTEDYDSAVGLIAEADHVAGGLLVPCGGNIVNSGTGRREEDWTDAERRKIHNALTIRQFLEQTQSQLTYHGLFHLASTLPAGSLVALFRNSHLSVLYKSQGDGETEAQVHADRWQSLDDTPDVQQPVADSNTHQSIPLNELTTEAESEPATEAHTTPPSHSESFAAPLTTESLSELHLKEQTSIPSTSDTQPQIAPPLDEAPISSHTVPTNNVQPSAMITTQTSPPDSTIPSAAVSQPESTPTQRPSQAPPQSQAHASALYALATDHVFLNEPSVVWERIEDVDGSAGVFVDSLFVHASPVGGDWAGRTAEDAARDYQGEQVQERSAGAGGDGPALTDHELARQLQAEEDDYAAREQERHSLQQGTREQEERRQEDLHARREKERKRKGDRKKKDCIIM